MGKKKPFVSGECLGHLCGRHAVLLNLQIKDIFAQQPKILLERGTVAIGVSLIERLSSSWRVTEGITVGRDQPNKCFPYSLRCELARKL